MENALSENVYVKRGFGATESVPDAPTHLLQEQHALVTGKACQGYSCKFTSINIWKAMQTLKGHVLSSKGSPGSRCVKEPTTKSSVDTASRSSSSSWRRIIHLTPARLIPSKARSTTTEIPRTAQMFLRLSKSEMDSAKPVMYRAPATH